MFRVKGSVWQVFIEFKKKKKYENEHFRSEAFRERQSPCQARLKVRAGWVEQF